MSQSTSGRLVAIDGAHNFRDIGGYRNRDGKMTAWGRVFRSGTLADIAPDGLSIMQSLGLATVCDLRSTGEREAAPSRFPENHGYNVLARDHLESSVNLKTMLVESGLTAPEAREIVAEFYRKLPEEQGDSYRVLFKALAQGEWPLLFHCAAGKDRTGVAAALLLDVLGIDRQTVIEDYVLTDLFRDDAWRIFRSKRSDHPFLGLDDDVFAQMLRADPYYLIAMFGALEKQYGSASGYVIDYLGLSAEQLGAIRDHLLVEG